MRNDESQTSEYVALKTLYGGAEVRPALPAVQVSSQADAREECRFQVVMPRSCVTQSVRDECVAAAIVLKMVAAEHSDPCVRVRDPTDFHPEILPGTRMLIRDQRHVRAADLVVAIANGPSSGMGDECRGAVIGTVPRALIVRRGTPISPVLRARLAPLIAVFEYDSLEQLREMLREAFPKMVTDVLASQSRRRTAIKAIKGAAAPCDLFKIRMRKSRTLQSISVETDIPEADLRELERDPAAWADASSVQLQRISAALDFSLHFTPRGALEINDGDCALPENVKTSLNNLYQVLREDGVWLPCERVLECWRGYTLEANYLPDAQTVEMRDTAYPIWTKATWTDRLRAADEQGPSDHGLFPDSL